MTHPFLFKEYIWLVKTIYDHRRISLSEINRLWVDTDMSGGVEMARSTFNRHNADIDKLDARQNYDQDLVFVKK